MTITVNGKPYELTQVNSTKSGSSSANSVEE